MKTLLVILSILFTTNRVVDWQVDAYPRMNDIRQYKAEGDYIWENAIFLFSTMQWAAATDQPEYADWGLDIARRNSYGLFPKRIYHADDLVIGSFYARCFDLTGDSAMLRPTYERLRYIVEHPSQEGLDLDYRKPQTLERWSWCDALFMAPPVFAEYARLFHDPELLTFMDREFWATVDYLYSPADSLFYRDSGYFNSREANGRPVFWGRGNAWVISGLARLILLLPAEMRPRYEALFVEMAQRLLSLQQPDGSWHASMLDPESYPAKETSSTGLIAFSYYWGMCEGLLAPDEYLPAAERAWQALVSSIHRDGMLGNVQPIGADPRAMTADMTEVYGAAAMELTAEQMLRFNARKALLARAEELLDATPLSVMRKLRTPASGDKHDYMSIARYTWPNPATSDGLPYIHRDGETNPEMAQYDRLNLGITAERVTTLSRAYALTHDERFAKKATELLTIWFLDKATRMNPNLRYAQVVRGVNKDLGRAVGTIDAYSFVGMLEAVDGLRGSVAYTAKIDKSLRRWFGDLATWMRKDSEARNADGFANNLSIAYDVELVSFLHFAGRDKEAKAIVSAFPMKRLAQQITPDGRMPHEETRTLPYHYSHYNLDHILTMSRMAETLGVPFDLSRVRVALNLQNAGCYAVNRRHELREWDFRRMGDADWQTVRLPHSTNDIDGQSERYYRGETEYRTTVTLMPDCNYSLLFMGAAQRATVFLDETELISHPGGYTPFTVDLPRVSAQREAVIRVVCDNTMDLTIAPVSSDFNKNNGLHDRVYLLESGAISIDTHHAGYDGMLVSTKALSTDRAEIEVKTFVTHRALSTVPNTQAELHVRVLDADGVEVAEHKRPLRLAANGLTEVTVPLTIESPRLWQGLRDPHLYTVELTLMQSLKRIEHRTTRVGLRTIVADPERGFLLNGEPLLLRGFSYHRDLYGAASAMTDQDVDRDFDIIRDLGCNMLRVAHYPHSRYTFDRCDELGILVQTEIPWVNECGGDTSRYDQTQYGRNLIENFREMVIGHYNHPSIAFVGMWNELGGSHANRPQGDLDTTFLVAMTDTLYRLGRKLDPTRLYGFADMGYAMNIHQLERGKHFDYFGVNKYYGWYQDTHSPEGGPAMGSYMEGVRARHHVCAVTEYGAGSSPTHHSADPVSTTNPATGGARHDEEWANVLHESHVRAIQARPWLLFTTGWVLFDFAVADRREGDTQFINDKGIATRDRSLLKDAFYLYRAWWNPAPTVYICSRRWTERTESECTIRVYSNATSLSLYRSGVLVETIDACPDSTGLIWQFSPIPVTEDGEATYRVVGTYLDGSIASDEITLRHGPSTKRN